MRPNRNRCRRLPRNRFPSSLANSLRSGLWIGILLAARTSPAQQPADIQTALKSPDTVSDKVSPLSPNPPQNAPRPEDFRLQVETDLVVLHATVTDKNDHPVPDLQQESFRVLEDNVEQKLKVFKREDIPVSVGIVVDNSGSMRDKRRGVNEAALKFVRSSNPKDEVFLVNFNDEAFLDADFTDNIPLLEEGLEKIGARGGTAFYDALDVALDHLIEKGSRDKKVLLLVTDGEDNASRLALEPLVQSIQRSNVLIYTVGLLGDEGSRSLRRAKRALEAISKASGGAAFFPKNLSEVQEIATAIANDIRNQYVLAYSPTNLNLDGRFRKVEIKVSSRKYGKLSVRTRSGYYAETPPLTSTQANGS